jgi:hypothetical protein
VNYENRGKEDMGDTKMKPKGGHCMIEDLAGHNPGTGDIMPSITPVSNGSKSPNGVERGRPREGGSRVPYGD